MESAASRFYGIMFNDELTDRVVVYTRIMRWALPLTILVTFLVFVAAGNSSLALIGYAFHALFWGCVVLSGFFVLSIPFVFIEHWRCGFICLGTVVVSYLLVSGVMTYPMMKIQDGCPCGMSRSWYE